MADRSDAATGSGAELMCSGCKHELRGTPPRYSITGSCLCPGCADYLDAATCGLAAMSGVAGSSATAMWFGRAGRRTWLIHA